MAVVKSIMKITDTESVIKISGSADYVDVPGTSTITLATDLLHSTQVVEGTPTVNIIGANWTGDASAVITITRNSVRIMTLNAGAAGMLYFDGQQMPAESTHNTFDIVVDVIGPGQGELWLKVKKVAGYQSKIEDWKYGSYDDPTRVGASTTLNGSPDKV